MAPSANPNPWGDRDVHRVWYRALGYVADKNRSESAD
jgi:hypothetical protein